MRILECQQGIGRLARRGILGPTSILREDQYSVACHQNRLDAFVRNDRIDWERLDATTDLAVRFLDDVIEVSEYPFAEVARASRASPAEFRTMSKVRSKTAASDAGFV
mgnify:CR=1 FL=1